MARDDAPISFTERVAEYERQDAEAEARAWAEVLAELRSEALGVCQECENIDIIGYCSVCAARMCSACYGAHAQHPCGADASEQEGGGDGA